MTSLLTESDPPSLAGAIPPPPRVLLFRLIRDQHSYHPMFIKGHVRQGQALHGLGMHRQAICAYEQALKVWMGDPRNYTELHVTQLNAP